MNVVDSSGWLEYFARGTNVSFFAPVIKATENLVVPTICIFDVFKRLLTQRGEENALQAIGIMSLGILADLTREISPSMLHIFHLNYRLLWLTASFWQPHMRIMLHYGPKMPILKGWRE